MIIIDEEGPFCLRRIIKRWPAVILAVKRTERVIGRIILLIDSINTINGIKMKGVLKGIKCVNICWVFLIQPKIIKVSHKGRA